MIDKPIDITDSKNVAAINEVIAAICNGAAGVQHTATLPTIKTVGEGKFVIYDDDNGTKRIYVVTGKKNLGYITLT